MCGIRPSAVLRSRIDLTAVFVDTILVIRRTDEVYVVAVAAAGMARDAIQNLCAV